MTQKPCIAHHTYEADCAWCRSGKAQAKPKTIMQRTVTASRQRSQFVANHSKYRLARNAQGKDD